MFKLVFVISMTLFALQTQETAAYKLSRISVQKVYGPPVAAATTAATSAEATTIAVAAPKPSSTAAASPAAPALNPNALIQGLQGAIAAKLSTVSGLVGTVVQLKQNVARSLLSTVSSKIGTLTSAAGSLPSSITKTISFGAPAPAASSAPYQYGK